MDWENKFSSILRETESNLSKLKTKFATGGSALRSDWRHHGHSRHFSSPARKTSSLLNFPLSSPTKPGFDAFSSLREPPPPMSPRAMEPSSGVGYYPNPMVMTSGLSTFRPNTDPLQGRLDQQAKTIEQLSEMVHRLHSERSQYTDQLRDLRNEIYILNNKVTDRGVDPAVDRRVEQVKRELMGEIQMLQNQLQFYKAKGDGIQFTDSQMLTFSKDMMEIKHTIRDELENLRRDMEVLKSRVGKVEHEITSMLSNRRDNQRRQDKLDRTVHDISSSGKQSKLPSISYMDASRNVEQMQIEELRSTVSTLRNKLNTMEITLRDKDSPASRPIMNGYGPGIKPMMNGIDPMISDLDLSDDDGVDSEDLDYQSVELSVGPKRKGGLDLEPVDTEGLDLDDLNLSDDDSVSLGSGALDSDDL